MLTTWTAVDVSWFNISEWATEHVCFERQRYRRCNCSSGRKNKKYNPCDKGIAIEQNALARGLGEPLPNDFSIQDIINWIESKTCMAARQGMSCNHRGCDRTANLVNWLVRQQRKAA